MKKISVLLVLATVFAVSGCIKNGAPSPVTPVVNGVIDCLKTQKAALQKNVPVLQVAMDVVSAVIDAVTTKDLSDAVKKLVAKYAPVAGDTTDSLIACSVQKAEDAILAWTGAGSNAGSGTADKMMLKAAPDKKAMVDAVIAEHGWKFAN